MTRRLDDIINDVDAEISMAMAQEKVASEQQDFSDSDIEGVISELNKTASAQVKAPEGNAFNYQSQPDPQDEIEKIAHMNALNEAESVAKFWSKMGTIEKTAQSNGVPQYKIDDAIEKMAKKNFRGLGRLLPYLGGGAVAAGASVVGDKHGKKTGYNQALQDVDKAMREYSV